MKHEREREFVDFIWFTKLIGAFSWARASWVWARAGWVCAVE